MLIREVATAYLRQEILHAGGSVTRVTLQTGKTLQFCKSRKNPDNELFFSRTTFNFTASLSSLFPLHKSFPGILLAVVAAALAFAVSLAVPNLSATLLALLLGIVLGNSKLVKERHNAGIRFTEKYILETSIVLIGFGFQLELLMQLGWPVFLWLLFSVMAVVGFAALVGRLFGSPGKFNVLLGAGSAICGSAAIAATAPLLRADDEETGLALTLINLLGLIGIAALPVISLSLGYSDLEAGVLTGGVLQSMGHVVAAAFSLNDLTGEVATVVKMGRISLLVPFLLILFFRQKRKSKNGSAPLKFPVFIGLFIASVAISQFGFFPAAWSSALATTGDFLLVIAMAGIGLKIRIRPLLKISARGSMIGTAVFIFQIVLFLALLSLDWI